MITQIDARAIISKYLAVATLCCNESFGGKERQPGNWVVIPDTSAIVALRPLECLEDVWFNNIFCLLLYLLSYFDDSIILYLYRGLNFAWRTVNFAGPRRRYYSPQIFFASLRSLSMFFSLFSPRCVTLNFLAFDN